jgi:hypothetical protein
VLYDKERNPMSKTVHVIHEDGRWAVKREGHSEVFPTQREAIERAREIAKRESSGQLVVHGRDGQIRERFTYGMPPIQGPPAESPPRLRRPSGRSRLTVSA